LFGKQRIKEMPNLALPGNPRTQPRDLVDPFGYDNLARTQVEVQLACMTDVGRIRNRPGERHGALTDEVVARAYQITTTEIDKVERDITLHDVRALVFADSRSDAPSFASMGARPDDKL
jgi:adenylosuccinate lyase